jgi:hypothetical protein
MPAGHRSGGRFQPRSGDVSAPGGTRVGSAVLVWADAFGRHADTDTDELATYLLITPGGAVTPARLPCSGPTRLTLR